MKQNKWKHTFSLFHLFLLKITYIMVEVLATGNNDIGLKMPGFQIVALIVFPKVRAIRNVMGGVGLS